MFILTLFLGLGLIVPKCDAATRGEYKEILAGKISYDLTASYGLEPVFDNVLEPAFNGYFVSELKKHIDKKLIKNITPKILWDFMIENKIKLLCDKHLDMDALIFYLFTKNVRLELT